MRDETSAMTKWTDAIWPFSHWRRSAELRRAELNELLERVAPVNSMIAPADRAMFVDRVDRFQRRVYWEGCAGFVVDRAASLRVSAHAQWLGLGLPNDPFRHVSTVLIYPQPFVGRRKDVTRFGLHEESDEGRLGEAWVGGTVILVWEEVLRDCAAPDAARNVILHEFAHQIDMADGDAEGTPAVLPPEMADDWQNRFEREFEALQRSMRRGRASVVDPYAATSLSEFFAVSTEAYFLAPAELREERPNLYDLLFACYRQHPQASQGSVSPRE